MGGISHIYKSAAVLWDSGHWFSGVGPARSDPFSTVLMAVRSLVLGLVAVICIIDTGARGDQQVTSLIIFLSVKYYP